jgi:N-acetylglucosamine-6-phosphate deacetylase
MYHVYFPEEYIELQKELQHHPKLIDAIQQYKQDDGVIIILHIAAYCGVIVDGTYVEEDLVKLAGILLPKLKAMRETPPPIIVS